MLLHRVNSTSESFLGVDIAPCTNRYPSLTALPLSRQDTREIILIHQIAILGSLLLHRLAHVLLLILSKNQVDSPSALAAPIRARVLAARRAMDRLRHAEHIPALVELEVALQVD